MNTILTPVVIVGIIAVILGLGLAFAAKVFAVPVNEKVERIRECLPGANCGACGFSGCDGYADALANGKTKETNLCGPGGKEAAIKISTIMGTKTESIKGMVAVVLCQGNHRNVKTKINYIGASNCKMATQLFGGPRDCTYGCLGFGDCVKACPYEAIFICDGVARINPKKCRACKKCISICPRGLIELFPVEELHAAVFCKNSDKGQITRKACAQGCIACTKCVKICEAGAISIDNNKAKVDRNICIGCGKCVEQCPTGAINLITL